MLPANRTHIFFCFRIGFVFVVNAKDEMDGLSDAGVGFYRLLNYIADEYDVPQALMSTLSVSSLRCNLNVKISASQF